ncbi:MAG: uracil-DNA glycosylase [Solirubrobacteraceae bacterium]|nr:uracil-DNA glycosylase [Solirubrobacteraceae bacterium]
MTAHPERYITRGAGQRDRDYHRHVPSAPERRLALKALYEQASTCPRCPELAATRISVVFGAGNADADLMFVGEAPGANEDRQGLPFVGAAGKLLERLLNEIGLARADVFIANVLKCRPPGNRDPQPGEIENCRPYLRRQVELIEPRVICTLGNFSTKLLREDPTGISRIHGRPEVRTIGGRSVRIYPIYHPAAALYTPRMLDTLREDFARLPALLALPAPPPPIPDPRDEPPPPPAPDPRDEPPVPPGAPPPPPGPAAARPPDRPEPPAHPNREPEPEVEPGQLGLF